MKNVTPSKVPALQAIPVVSYAPPQMTGVRSLIDINLTKDEVIDAMIETERTMLEDKLEDIQTEIAVLRKEDDEFIQKETEKIQKTLAKDIQPVRRALEKLTKKPHKAVWAASNLNINGPYFQVALTQDDQYQRTPTYTHTFSYDVVLPLIPKDELTRRYKKRTALEMKAQEITREMNNLTKKGRRARSSLVIELLKGSDDGKKMLSAAEGAEKRRAARQLKN